MPIDFPSSPTTGQKYTYNGVTYTYSPQGVWASATPSGYVQKTGDTMTGSLTLTGGNNYIRLDGTQIVPEIDFYGSDTNVNGSYSTKGSGAHSFYTNAGAGAARLGFQVLDPTGTPNTNLQVYGGTNLSYIQNNVAANPIRFNSYIQAYPANGIGIQIGGNSSPQIQFSPASGATKQAQMYQSGDGLNLSSVGDNSPPIFIDLNTRNSTFRGSVSLTPVNGDAVININSPAAGNNALVYYYVSGVRQWYAGVVTTGAFRITDVSGAVSAFEIAPSETVTTFYSTTLCGATNGGTTCYGGTGLRYNYWTPNNYTIGFSYGTIIAGYASVHIEAGSVNAYAIQTACDERLKSDIAPSTHDCIKQVLEIPLFQFRWMDHSTPGQPVENPSAPLIPVGFISQRVYAIAPHLSVKGDNYPQMRTTAQIKEYRAKRGPIPAPRAGELKSVGEPGPYINDGNTMWMIQQNNMLALLTGAIKQLVQRNTELEARLLACEQKLQ